MRWFRDSEFHCQCGDPKCGGKRGPHRLLALYLDRARDMYGKPMIITSGNRCPVHNQCVGGAEGSEHAHPDGCLGVDLRCTSSRERWEMLDAIRHAGITRIGFYAADGHIHVGVGDAVDTSKWAPDLVWVSA